MNTNKYPVRGLRPETTIGTLAFSPNGSSDPSSSYTAGSLKRFLTSIARSGTGTYLLTFKEGFKFPNAPHFIGSAQWENATNHFQVATVGAYDSTNRTLTVVTHRNGTATDIPASSGAGLVHLNLVALDSTGQ